MGMAVSMGLSLLGGMASANAQYNEGMANADAYTYQAQVAKNNAIIANQNTNWATEFGDVSATAESMKSAGEIGALKARQGASGVDVNTGSNADVRAGAERLAEVNALTVKSNAAREAYGYTVQKSNYTNQAHLDEVASADAKQGANTNYWATLLGTAGSVAGQYSRWQSVGAGV